MQLIYYCKDQPTHMNLVFLLDKTACTHPNCIQTKHKAHKKFKQEENATKTLEMFFSSAHA